MYRPKFHTPGAYIDYLIPVLILVAILATGGNSRSGNDNGNHESASCGKCHRLQYANQTNRSIRGDACRDCHNINDLAAGDKLGFHDTSARPCTDCHSFHQTEQINAGADVFKMDFHNNHALEHCRSCHSGSLGLEAISAGHRAARELYHIDYEKLTTLSPSAGCLRCHGSAESNKATDKTAPYINNHASHPFNQAYSPGNAASGMTLTLPAAPEVRLIEGRIECQTCHSLTSLSKFLMPANTTYGQLCTSCHIDNLLNTM